MIRVSQRCRFSGFMLLELLVVLFAISILIAPRLISASKRERVYVTIDLNNMRQILYGSALYSAENDDRLAHPTWGSDLTGPDGWAYLTSNASRDVPGAIRPVPGSCAGRDINSAEFTNQLAYFKVGQVAQYLPSVKTAWCPKDVATRGSGQLRQLWLSRPVKVTSYAWTGTISGYDGRPGDLGAKTYKISDFLPTDFQMWEKDEDSAFNFNDAGSSPFNSGEWISRRHLGNSSWWSRPVPASVSGGGIVGAFGGSAHVVKWRAIQDYATGRIPRPNAFMNGPDNR